VSGKRQGAEGFVAWFIIVLETLSSAPMAVVRIAVQAKKSSG